MDEQRRQETIQRYSLAGRETEPSFDRVTQLATSIFDAPIALVTVLALERQLFRGACGLAGEGTPREVAFCEYAVRGTEVMVVEDAQADPRFANNPLVTGEPYIRFYAGAPVRVGENVAIGTLCVIDQEPRQNFSQEDRRRLEMLAATISDIIELRAGSLLAAERERDLKRQAHLLEGTVENVEQGIAVFGPDFRLVLWNERFFDLFDFPADLAIAGTPAEQLVSITAARGEMGPGRVEQVVGEFFEGARTTTNRRREIHRISGQVLDVWRNRMSDGNFILAASDVTAERELARTKDEFISTVNHELRTPLTSILGSLSLLKAGVGGELPPRADKLITMAHQNGQRLNALINDLLDIEKVATGGLQLNLVPLELGAVVQKAAEQNRGYADGFGVSLKADIPSEPLWVKGEESRLLQALANLISNAVKFSPDAGEVDLALAGNLSSARIAVIDRGPGIPDAFRAQLFERFAQANPNDARTKGTGLGLAITKALIELQGGRIDFTSEPGHGTTFWIEMPRCKENEV